MREFMERQDNTTRTQHEVSGLGLAIFDTKHEYDTTKHDAHPYLTSACCHLKKISTYNPNIEMSQTYQNKV